MNNDQSREIEKPSVEKLAIQAATELAQATSNLVQDIKGKPNDSRYATQTKATLSALSKWLDAREAWQNKQDENKKWAEECIANYEKEKADHPIEVLMNEKEYEAYKTWVANIRPETEIKTHDTVVMGIRNEVVIFLKSYDYKNQKEEAQRDLDYVQNENNGFTGWYITNLNHWILTCQEDKDEDKLTFNLPIPKM